MNELSLKAVDYPTAESFDAVMRGNFDRDQLAVHLDGGTFYTQGTREWADSPDITLNPGFRIKNWTFDTQSGATLKWDHSKIEPTSVPIALIRTTEMSKDLARVGLHADEEIWLGQPRGQRVADLTFDLQFDTALPKWKAAGLPLRIGATALGGHQFAMERLSLINWGAYGYEGFLFYGQGAYGMYDRNAIARLDPTTHIFDDGVTDSECSHITECTAQDVDESLSNDQVTIRYIGGSMGNPDASTWVQTPRAYAYQRGNRTLAKGKNRFQAHTIYQSLRGDITQNFSQGAAVGVYGDFCRNKGLQVWLNQFLECDYAGIRFLLSPTAQGMGNAPEQFSHEDYEIGPNQITSRSGIQVELDTYESQIPGNEPRPTLPLGPERYIRGMRVDASLLLEAKGTIPGIVRTGQVAAQAKGCSWNPFRRG